MMTASRAKWRGAIRQSCVVIAGATILTAACATAAIGAQSPSVKVDTVKLRPEARAALGTWYRYLANKGAQYSRDVGADSSLWLESERRKWRSGDLSAAYLPDGASADIVRIEPVTPNDVNQFRIITRFATADGDDAARTAWRDVTVTVFVMRINGRWQLSNALARNTTAWKHDTVRTIEYVYPSGRAFNRAAAERAAAFVDSLTNIFALPRIERTSYFLFDTNADALAALGLELPVNVGAVSDISQPHNNLLVVSAASGAEADRHSLARMALAPLMAGGTSTFIAEGVPTFFGGALGVDYPTAVAGLAAWMRAHPSVTLDSLMRSDYPREQTLPAAAVVADVVNEAGGRHGLKLLFDIGINPSEMREGLQRITKFQWSRFVEEWNLRVADFAKKEP